MDELWHDSESWGLILGVVSPLLIAVVQQPGWSKTLRMVIGWGAAIVIGLLTCLAEGSIGDGETVLRTVAVTLVASQAAYAGLKHGPASAIERGTSPHARRVPPAGPPA